jgi:hypothetical protein
MNIYFTGDDWAISGTVTNPDGTAFNLTAATLSIAVVNEFDTVVGAAQSGTIVNALSGTWSCTIPKTLTATVPTGYAWFQLQVTQGSLKQEYCLDTIAVEKGLIA